MKKIYLLFLVLSVSAGLMAQEERKAGSERYVTNGFWDNWEASLGVGGQVYVGEDDSKADFFDRVSPALELSVGKWIVPSLGLRAQAFGWQAKAAAVGLESGIFLEDGATATGLNEQKWNFAGLHGDLMLNASNFFGGYKTDRVYEAIPYVGFGAISQVGEGVDNLTATGVIGIINRFKVNEKIAFNVEAKMPLVDQGFDGFEDDSKFEGIPSVTVGITYKFKNPKFQNAAELTAPKSTVSEEDLARLRNQLAAEQGRAKQLQDELDKERARKNQVVVEKGPAIVAPLAVFFPFDKATLTAKEKINLENVANVIKQNPGLKYSVSGYADKGTGTAEYNKKLATRRVNAVRDVLVKSGVDEAQLNLNPVGATDTLFPEPYLNRVVIIENK